MQWKIETEFQANQAGKGLSPSLILSLTYIYIDGYTHIGTISVCF